ncbi:sigma-54-specific transcriptional regulator [Aquabacterium commune]|uniref:Sigma-54-specific transcriptional regulator n=1 Tax=Aquabacterium commune TaxID=70586 RepID=A0A4R6RNB2_9BURK|nr:sigma-54 dependent transcriptional regulator [Aquabacterium commune]TDP88052.1 sigma-54-specific transcriptional regulator [Aquabacterium commune]
MPERLLTLPESSASSLSIRAKALVFHDPASLQLLRDVERIARSEATVLVTGETGTGKELIARHIHAVSGRTGPFVAVNCGAFSETLIDAELFGHESGAFTGASHARAGWFEAANGGTLFLDEIGDLPLGLQVKLLRVLQERQVVRLGSRRGIPLDVRLVAATNIDLARAVEAQHFRADLYYRLSVASVRLPPLRERPADILPLVRHFISVYRSRLHLGDVAVSEAAQDALTQYSWPGNIRELENVIHYALIVCRDHTIEPQDIRLLPLTNRPAQAADASVLRVGGLGSGGTADANDRSPASAPMPVSGVAEVAGASAASAGLALLHSACQALLDSGWPDLFDTVESTLVHAAFAHAGSNQVRAARLLGITRNMMRTQLKRHGLLQGDDLQPDVAEAGASSASIA